MHTFFDCLGSRTNSAGGQNYYTEIGTNIGTSYGNVWRTAEELGAESLDAVSNGRHRVRVHVLRLVSVERCAPRIENIRLASCWKH